MDIQTVIFDLDGTLLDTLDDLADSVNAVLIAHGMPVHSRDAYKWFVGDGARELVRRSLPRTGSSTHILNSIVLEVKAEYSGRWNKKTKPYPGIKELLESLKAQKMKMGVLTNKPHEFTEKMVGYYFPKINFDSVKGLKEGVPQKPDPIQIFEMFKELHITPETCLYLGDSDVDMMTAKRAGVYAVGALWGFRDRLELTAHGAMDVAVSPADVIPIIEKISLGNKS